MENTFDKDLLCIQEHLPTWKDLTPEEVTFFKFPNGLSREVYRVTTQRKDIAPSAIIFRKFIHGPSTNEVELLAFKELSTVGLAAKLYATNKEYQIEEYFPSRTIKSHEINQKVFRRKLVMSLAAIHKLQLKDNTDKKGYFEKRLDDEFYKNFNAKCDLDYYNEDEAKFIKEIRYLASKEEVEFIRDVISKEKLVLSHNDVWVANILVVDNTSDVIFIDYEVMEYNFPGYDIGKLIFETMFDRPNAPKPYWEIREDHYPSEEEIKDFARYYLIASKSGPLNKEERDKLINDEEAMKQYESKLFASEKEYNDELEDLLIEIRVGLMISCYWWTLMGVVVGKGYSSEFDFIRFAKDNFRFYEKFKGEYLSGIAGKKLKVSN